MKELIEILTKETQELKIRFINDTEKWASSYHSLMVKRNKWEDIDWCKFLGLQPELKNKGTSIEFYSFPKGFYNTKDARLYDTKKNEARAVSQTKLESYVSAQIKLAEKHYSSSIEKLAFRIGKKNMDLAQLVVKTSSIGVNIETILTDGKQTVKAFTIVAEGEIQRPHYRYLIK